MPDDAAWAEHVVVPDDIRDLQSDVEDYQREQRLARRRRRWAWLVGSALWRRWSFPIGVLTGALTLAAVVFTLLAVESAPPRAPAGPLPLAATSARAGSVGGLLPDVSVTTTGTTMSVRELRPALVTLVPLHCSCTPLLESLAREAARVRIRFVVVAPGAQDAEVAALPGQIPNGLVTPVYDASGTLAATYAAKGVTVLGVRRDGVMRFESVDVTDLSRERLPLEVLLVTPLSFTSGTSGS